jgi:hypothetical protein
VSVAQVRDDERPIQLEVRLVLFEGRVSLADAILVERVGADDIVAQIYS